jgi:hypothetical protein
VVADTGREGLTKGSLGSLEGVGWSFIWLPLAKMC